MSKVGVLFDIQPSNVVLSCEHWANGHVLHSLSVCLGMAIVLSALTAQRMRYSTRYSGYACASWYTTYISRAASFISFVVLS